MGEITIEFEFRNKRFNDAAVGLKAFAETIGKDWDGSAKVLSAELKSFLDTVAEALALRHGGAWPGGTTKDTLSKRSGDLVDSIIKSVQVTGNTFGEIVGHIGAGGIYASIQEYGGTITAKGKLLTVPLPAALNPNGTPIKKSARDWDNTFVARSKKGNLLIFQKVGTQIIPLYVLKESVTIPPRLGMQDTINATLPYFVDKAMDAMVKAIVNQEA